MRQRTGGPMAVPAPLQQLEGSALIVGQGGIGSAITELLQHNCPQLTVLPLGRRSQPRLDLCNDAEPVPRTKPDADERIKPLDKDDSSAGSQTGLLF